MTTHRLATFNIRHGRGADGRVDLERTAAAILETDASFVALQEIDRGLPRSGGTDQAERIAELTELRVEFWPTVELADGFYGIAVAARGDLESRFMPLPQASHEEPRGAIVARWRGLTVVATHLSPQPDAREAQVAALAALVPDLEPPVVLLGDLNAPLRRLGPLRAAGLAPGPGRLITFPSVRSRRQIDHVLAGPGIRIDRHWLVRSHASDHLPLVADATLI